MKMKVFGKEFFGKPDMHFELFLIVKTEFVNKIKSNVKSKDDEQ